MGNNGEAREKQENGGGRRSLFGRTLNSESLAFGSATFGAFSSVMMEHTGRFKSHSVNPSTSVSSSQEEAGLKVCVVVRFRLLISFIYFFFINKVFALLV
jgi:hypothetical protein